MAVALTQDSIKQMLDWIYVKAVEGVPGFDSATEMARTYSKQGGNAVDQANSLIRWQNTKAGTSGFLAGLGGLLTMPVTVPANISSVIYVQVRMIAAIAALGGHDVRDDRDKAMVYACLAGNGAKDILKDVGIVVGRKLTENAIKSISGKALIEINKKVGFRLFVKAGETGIVNLSKAVPLVGGLVGLAFDAATTNFIGNIAREVFIEGAMAPETMPA